MRKNEKNAAHTARRVQTIALCGCLCLVAIGAGVTYRAFDNGHLAEEGQEGQMAQEQPVTAVQSPTLDAALLERNKRSNDPGEAPAEEPKQEQKTAEPVFAYPLEGEVVLEYSIDHAIYDPTLDQYRTNASISLSAEEGALVKAAADGTVKEVTMDAEAGHVVILEHANGWLTTYGQLEETVKVKKGEAVKQGQAIGAVDAPTKYGVALGSHLEFAMEQNGTPVDPREKLQEAE